MSWKIRARNFSLQVLLVGLAGILTAFNAWGQSASTGALTGTVTDTSGGVVAGATVTLTSLATQRTDSKVTTENGAYKFVLLPPGEYSLKVSATGFETVSVASLVINVTETKVKDITLTVGRSETQVTVEGSTPILQTQESTEGTLVDHETVNAIPLTTRNYTQILSLSSGVVSNVNNAANLGRGSVDMNVNGNGPDANTYLMDGSQASNWVVNAVGDSGGQTGGISIVNPDAIAEFKVQTAQYDASTGRTPGGAVNVVTKSGTNEFHGTAFEFLRNDVFNANDFFRAKNRQDRPVLKQNQFGATIGGPIKKEKVFFFGSYQGTRQRNGLTANSLSTVTIPALTDDRSRAAIGSEFCPANKAANVQALYQTFAGGEQVACDGSNISSVAMAILQKQLPDGSYFIPTPQNTSVNSQGALLGQSSFSIPAAFREDQVLVGTDYVISPKHTLSERFFYSYDPSTLPFNAYTLPGNGTHVDFRNHNPTLKLTSLLTTNLVNEVRVGYTRVHGVDNSLNLPPDSDLGITSVTGLPPVMAVTGPLGGFTTFGNTQDDVNTIDDTLEISDQVSWVHGRQSFRFGGNWNKNKWDMNAPGWARGNLTFQTFDDFLLGAAASDNGSPNGYSNIISETARIGTPPSYALVHQGRTKNLHLFAQDDVQVSKRLTLNLGLRWEYIGNFYDDLGVFGNILNSVAATEAIPPAGGTYVGYSVASNDPRNDYPDGVIRRKNSSAPQSTPPLDNFAPRIGFAWTPGKNQNKLVVRGGYGWYFWENTGWTDGGNTVWNVQPYNYFYSQSLNSNGGASLANPFPGVPNLPGFVLRTVSTLISDSNMAEKVKDPMVQQYSLNFQYQILPSTTFEIGYVGARGAHLTTQIPTNQPQIASAENPVNCGLPNTAAGLGVTPAVFATLGIDANGCVTTNTTGNARYRVPLVGFAPTALSQTGFVGMSWYNALQTTLRRNLTHGVFFQLSYTYSKALADTPGTLGTSAYNDATIRRDSWGSAPFDRRNRFVASYNWQIPTPFHDGFTSMITGGWSLAGVVTMQTGSALTLLDTRGGTIFGGATPSTAYLCPGATSIYSSGSDTQRIGDWFNPAAFCAPQALPGSAVTAPGNTGVGFAFGPGQNNWDFTVSKYTKVGGLRESATLQFRAEFYNAFNHPQFSNPALNASAGTFGQITSTSVAPRLIQFGLKYIF